MSMRSREEHVRVCDEHLNTSWERYHDSSSRWDPLRKRIHYIISKVKVAPVLDVGCAEGLVCFLLAKEGFDQITGVDVSSRAINRAHEIMQELPVSVVRGVRLEETWAESLPFGDAEFATVVLTETLEHVLDLESVVREVDRVLQPGGRLILSVPFQGKVSVLHLRSFQSEHQLVGLFPPAYVWHKLRVIPHLPKPKAWLVGCCDKS